jgi:hypothetical protein
MTSKIEFWKVVSAVIAALAAMTSAFWVGYQMGRSAKSASSPDPSTICANGNRVVVHSKSNTDETGITILNLLAEQGCKATGIIKIDKEGVTDIRHFHDADENDAYLISNYLRAEIGIALPVKHINDEKYSSVEKGQLEIWID